MQQIGLLGGTFDPIHVGHLAIADEVRWRYNLDKVLFIPAGHQPHKPKGHCAVPEMRLAMAGLAIADNPYFELVDWEVTRPGLSYTVDTVADLHVAYPQTQFSFILGADALAALDRWHQIERLVELCRFIAVSRPGWRLDTSIRERLPTVTQIDVVEGPALDVSASALRERIRRGAPFRYQVPTAVYQYIIKHTLYLDCD